MPGEELPKSNQNTRPITGNVKLGNVKLAVPQETADENVTEHEAEDLESKRERDDSENSQSVHEKKPVVEIGPPRSVNGALSKGAVKDALQDWKVERSGPSGYRASRTLSRDRLDDQGSRVTAKRGSAKEVEGMFALAEAKNWDRMVFDGSDKFKERVMRTALEKGYEVKVNGKYDQKLFDNVRQKFEAENSNAMKGNSKGAELPKPSPLEPNLSPLEKNGPVNGAPRKTLLTGEPNERAKPALPAPKNVTPAREMLEEAQLNVSYDNEVAQTGPTKVNENFDVLKKTLTNSI